MFWKILAVIALAFMMLFAAPAKSCDVAVALLMDRSGSMVDSQFRLQIHGTAAAIRSNEVVDRIRNGAAGYIYIRTATFDEQIDWHTPWTRLSNANEAEQYARQVERTPRLSSGGTLVGWALNDAINSFQDLPEECARNVIDVSTDGVTGDELIVRRERDRAETFNITINAIMIEMPPEERARIGEFSGPQFTQLDLIEWAQDSLITGPNSFAYPATFRDYSNAMRSKLAAELAGVRPPFRFSMTLTPETVRLLPQP